MESHTKSFQMSTKDIDYTFDRMIHTAPSGPMYSDMSCLLLDETEEDTYTMYEYKYRSRNLSFLYYLLPASMYNILFHFTNYAVFRRRERAVIFHISDYKKNIYDIQIRCDFTGGGDDYLMCTLTLEDFTIHALKNPPQWITAKIIHHMFEQIAVDIMSIS